jgi:O-antigen/teichoic acid export membrane protein
MRANISITRVKPIRDTVERWMPEGRIGRGILALSGVTALSQAVGVLLSPVYTRLYSTSDYGVFALYSSSLNIFLTVGALCYEQGITIASDDDEGLDLVIISASAVMFTGLLTVLWLAGGFGLLKGDSSGIALRYMWLLPLGIIGSGIRKVSEYWVLRQKAVNMLARASIYQTVSVHAVMLGMGFLSPSPTGLILGGIVSATVGAYVLVSGALTVNPRAGRPHAKFSLSRIGRAAKRYRRLPMISAPSTFLNSIGLFLPAILVVSYYGTQCGGWLNLAQRFMELPMMLMGGSIRQVFFSEAADIARSNPSALKSFFDGMVSKALKVSIIIVLAGLSSPLIFPVVFGEQWREAGTFAVWMSLYCAVGLLVSPVSSVPAIVGRLRGQFWLDGVRAVLVFLAFYVPHLLGESANMAVATYSFVLVMMYAAYYILYRHLVSVVSKAGRTHWPTAGDVEPGPAADQLFRRHD